MTWPIALFFLAPSVTFAQQLVAPTEPLTPQEQQKKFHLPPGFEIQLVASEPDVHKPMNMNFDAHGRLWVTHSLEYPFPAKEPEKARDAITIFSEFGADGLAVKKQRFAGGLNIPIGVLPLSDKEALAWSIPNIYRLTDTDGDGVADAKSIVLGPYEYKDTHGDQNSFTRWVDGWVYANHGFSNNSKPKLKGEGDKPSLEMQSGHTYRFRPDASAAEIFSYGQVNPFGLSFDALGNLWSADCHSRAVTMLLREGYYPSFGKPHDGLGFAPETTDIDHGGTGIAGVVYYAADAFPPRYRDVLFIGNVITNRVHCDRLKWTGSTPHVEKVESFLTCDDPWFRPVNLQLGPDGALYVADFYNKIIGHYEVPLTHPGRDRERGRIWRIAYKGDGAPISTPMPDLTALSADQLLLWMGHENLTARTLATNNLIDRFPREVAATVATKAFDAKFPDAVSAARAQANAIWVLTRTGGLSDAVEGRCADSPDQIVRVHLMKALGERREWQPWSWVSKILIKGTADADPFVRRAAAEAMGRLPASQTLMPLVKLARETDPSDATLLQATRIAIRNHFRQPEPASGIPMQLEQADRDVLLSIAAVTPTQFAAVFISDEAMRGHVGDDVLTKAMPTAAKIIDAPRADAMVDLIAKRFPDDAGRQAELLQSIFRGLQERGLPPTVKMKSVLTDLLRPVIAGAAGSRPDWIALTRDGKPATVEESPWGVEPRDCKDGKKAVPVITSLKTHGPPGERLTGVLRSATFTLPAHLSFFICGHDGVPGTAAQKRDFVRLVLEDGTELAKVPPPRNDVATQFKYAAADKAGKRAYIEIVDGLSIDAYAWLAVGRFEPAVVRVPSSGSPLDGTAGRAECIRQAAACGLDGLTDDVAKAANDAAADASLKLVAGEALLTLKPDAAVTPLATLLGDANLSIPARQQAAQLLGRAQGADARTLLLTHLRAAPQPVAVAIAAAVGGSKDGAAALFNEIRAGRASAALLKEPTVADRLRNSGAPDIDELISDLAAKLSPADDRLTKLVADRRAAYLAGKFDVETGKTVFAKSVCAQCHKLNNVGGAIGPALDGIGNRGLDRLLEDVLDPNRNVDQAFRVTIVRTKKGQTYAGFNVREEGATLVMNDSAAKEIRVPIAEIDRRQASSLSPMPANVDQLMPEGDFDQLMAYLLSSRVK